MRIRLLVIAASLALVFVRPDGGSAAVSPTCLPTLPAMPGVPSVTLRVTDFDEVIDLTLWRQPCADGSGEVALLMQATPVSSNAYLCSYRLLALQGGLQKSLRIRKGTPAEARSFCDSLFGPTTVVVDEDFGEPPFDEEGAFTLIWRSFPASAFEIPAALPQPPPPTVQVVLIGCPCGPGTPATIKLVYTNPGPTQIVDLRFGARLPDGSAVGVLNDFLTLPSGASEATLLEGPFPSAPPGAYQLEAALLDSIFGVTHSRHTVALQVVP